MGKSIKKWIPCISLCLPVPSLSNPDYSKFILCLSSPQQGVTGIFGAFPCPLVSWSCGWEMQLQLLGMGDKVPPASTPGLLSAIPDRKGLPGSTYTPNPQAGAFKPVIFNPNPLDFPLAPSGFTGRGRIIISLIKHQFTCKASRFIIKLRALN